MSETELAFRPLYLQVREELLKRLIDGRWPPGMLLPSEHQLAAELGVSQGTLRKALDALAADRLLIRQQGRGTFVSVQEEGHFLFKFFRMCRDDGERHLPSSKVVTCRSAKADGAASRVLDLPPGGSVWRIERLRSIDGRAAIFEEIRLPRIRFPDLDRLDPLPNNIYALFASRYGVTIRRADERLKAVAAGRPEAERLDCAVGAPVLRIDRTAFSLDGAPVEWRIAYCRTDDLHYQATLT